MSVREEEEKDEIWSSICKKEKVNKKRANKQRGTI